MNPRLDRPCDRGVLTIIAIGMTAACLPFVSSVPLWLWPALVTLAGWRLIRARRGRGAPPTRQRTAAGLGLTALLILTGNVGLGLDAAIPLFLTFLWLKFLEIEGRRDLGMTAALSSFLAGAGVLLDLGLPRMLLSAFCLLLVWSALLAHHLPNRPRRWRIALRRTFTLTLQAAPVAAILFILLPRPMVPFSVQGGQGLTGMSDRLLPGDIDRLAQNTAPAFRVTFPDGVPPTASEAYWRGVVLMATDGRGWYRETRRSPATPPPQPISAGPDPEIRQHIILPPNPQPWVYALDPPTSFDESVGLSSGTTLVRTGVSAKPLSYQVTSRPLRRAADNDDFSVLLGRCLAVPDNRDARLDALAMEWRTQAGSARPADLSRAAFGWFKDQGFVYTLEPGAIDGDVVSGFLFDRKQGFCGHYASAFALVMRLAGVPSRVVMGYRGGEWNSLGSFLVVRQSHAHAWCELFDSETATWMRVDPTTAATGDNTQRIAEQGAGASGGRDVGSAPSRRLRQWWDWLDTSWQGMLYRYDQEAQHEVAESLGLGGFGQLGLLAAALGGALAVFAVVALLGAWAIRTPAIRPDDAQVLWQRWCASLARAGCARRPDEGPLAFARRASVMLPDRATDIDRITTAYGEGRYGDSPAARARLDAAVREAGSRRPSG